MNNNFETKKKIILAGNSKIFNNWAEHSKITKEQFAGIITQHNRCAAGDSAPAEGLFLTHVKYPEEIFLKE